MKNSFEGLARLGYAARGVVYLLLGGLTLTSAILGTGETADSSGALSSLTRLTFGRVIVALIAFGLLGHILWRLAQGFLDADGVGSGIKGMVGRIGSIVSAGANIFLLLTAASMAIGGQSGGGGEGETEASGWLLSQPFGALLLGGIALAVIGAGIAQCTKGISGSYRRRISFPPSGSHILDPICRFGLVARALLIIIVGCFALYAAWTVSPQQAGGVSDALDYVLGLPFGRIIYAAAALGLTAFGAYSAILGLYRRINAPTKNELRDALPI